MAGRRIALGLTLLAAACGAPPSQPELLRASPRFEPERFWAGRTEGAAELTIGFWKHELIRVESEGRVEPDGALVIDQTIRREEGRVQTRQWRLRKLAPGRYRGTLTDAAGPVEALAAGNSLKIGYRMKDGTEVEQMLYLDRAGRRADNRVAFKKRGVRVATIEERITKLR